MLNDQLRPHNLVNELISIQKIGVGARTRQSSVLVLSGWWLDVLCSEDSDTTEHLHEMRVMDGCGRWKMDGCCERCMVMAVSRK